ncbi:high affinity copper uptake protein 1-like isoform X1 [Pomacea canaliculata]|uniref:high affinity copper uptake protein 1-like isoform X1 n=1 Tax=Pomacea canaliculata TaxID=400727 RepID=UPI000D73BB0B|nr:high affinity copper uptake protein 1-like isoform X1 [Pomacea canaliculata]XP_025112171.1 high affinity copper uptake protein 1-like isoform X1 [Pomacea canaliculata]XP_025112172.1 high affinity copper uptake protein 1-like isoform X1 [Pomacea canaliculata]XP_025112173.1 high affinity copper uptake protein 1-like isoform X1 [Pomacea canaliculata]
MEGMPESEPGMNGMTTTLMAMNSSGTNGSSSGMNMNMNMGMSMDMPGMTMYFHDGYQEYILFQDLLTKSRGAFAGACIAVFFLGVFYELLKHAREVLQRRHGLLKSRSFHVNGTSGVDLRSVGPPVHEKTTETTVLLVRSQETARYTQTTPGESPPSTTAPKQRQLRTHHGVSYRTAMFSSLHLAQTVLHGLQILISYCLMLLFMTYNAYLCLCVILGITFGYFLVGWNRSSTEDVNEACH